MRKVWYGLFPEGTNSDGREVLTLPSSLFESAVTTKSPVMVAHISYELEDGDSGEDVCYWGNRTLVPHLVKLLSKTGVKATLRFADKQRVFFDRKQAAATAQQEIRKLAGIRKMVETCSFWNVIPNIGMHDSKMSLPSLFYKKC
jgi:1-acyl-sn-glycerol-3-phosphate acyltransferase